MTCWSLVFEISSEYDEREVENLLELLENLGAFYSHINGPSYRLFIPENFKCDLFYQTLLDCRSVGSVDTLFTSVNYHSN